MSLIIAENLMHEFDHEVILRNVAFRVSQGDRIGLIGPNGHGKTTLLRLAGRFLEPTDGLVHHRKDLCTGYLPQIPPIFGGGSTIYDAMLEVFTELRRQEDNLHDFAAKLADEPGNPGLIERYGAMQTQFETAGGYDYPVRIQQVLTGLGFERPMWSRPLDQLSGGQLTRVYLARLLLENPDILLLDEPTNHLDLDSVEWLESWLKSYYGALMVVSHDRYFLDRVTGYTWEIASKTLTVYKGAYSHYLTQREERQKEQLRRWESQQEHIQKTREFIARHLAGQRTKEAQGRRTRLERFIKEEAIDRPKDSQTIRLDLSAEDRTGDIVIRADQIVVGYAPDAPLVTAESLEVLRNQKIAILGANGTGKTTLLRTLLGQLEPLSGSVRPGANVRVGYLSQSHNELDLDATAIDSVMAAKTRCTDSEARDILAKLLLRGDDVFKKISQLSGGQRSRVALARLMIRQINVLFLDEPTNHLDIPSTEIMQEVLQEFQGAILFVSHDRYLVEAIATHIWALSDGSIRTIAGGWEEYFKWRSESQNQTGSQKTNGSSADEKKTTYRQARKQANQLQRLKRQHTQIELEIQTVEEELAKLNADISLAGQSGDLAKVGQLGKTYQQKDQHLKQLWNQWDDLTQKIELDA